jgi:hypothetical protein
MRVLIVGVLVLLFGPPSALAQVQLSRLDGVAVDASNAPLASVEITLSDAHGGVIRRTTADRHGRFVVADLAPGRYVVATSAAGVSATGPITVTLADGRPASVVLRVPPAFRDTLSVEAPLAPAVAARTSIGAASIARVPTRVRARGVQEAVATMPGWATEDNGLLHSRGVDDGFLYVVDGVPVYERIDQASGLGPDAASIESLTVVTGYVPPEFGYKAGGVIDIRTRTASGPWRGLAAIGGGGDDALDGEGSVGGGLGGSATLWLHAAGQRSSRFLDPVHPDNLHNEGGSVTTSGQAGAGTGARDRVVASWSGGSARFDVPNTEAQDAAGQAQRQRLGQVAVSTSWQRTWSGATVSQAAGYLRRARAQLLPSAGDTPITTEADRRLTRVGALAATSHQAGRHVIKAGGEIQQLRLDERFAFAVTDEDDAEDAGLSEAALAFDAGDPFRFAGRARPLLFSAYLQDTWQAAPSLTIAAGLRFDRTRILLARQQWSPRIGAALAITPTTALRASVSRFFQPPQPEFLLLASSDEARQLSPFADDAHEGGAEIEPERQWAIDAGVEHRFGRGLRLDVAYWERRVAEYADPNVFFGTTIVFPNAVASGRAHGLDARLEVAPGGAWSGYLNASVGSVRQAGPITGGLFLESDVAEIGPGVEFVPDHDQRVVASGGVTWTGRRGAELSAVLRHESGTPIELDDDEEADELAERPGADLVDFDRGRVRPRTIVSLAGSLPVLTTARLTLTVRAAVINLFDRRFAYNFGNPFSGTHFGAPRSATVSLRVESR